LYYFVAAKWEQKLSSLLALAGRAEERRKSEERREEERRRQERRGEERKDRMPISPISYHLILPH
jgi:hypothetical protein